MGAGRCCLGRILPLEAGGRGSVCRERTKDGGGNECTDVVVFS